MAVRSTLNATNITARSIRRGEVHLALGKSSISSAILRVRANVSTFRSWPVPEEPKRCDSFPEGPSTYLLSEGLARVAGVSYIDGLPV